MIIKNSGKKSIETIGNTGLLNSIQQNVNINIICGSRSRSLKKKTNCKTITRLIVRLDLQNGRLVAADFGFCPNQSGHIQIPIEMGTISGLYLSLDQLILLASVHVQTLLPDWGVTAESTLVTLDSLVCG